MTNRLLLCTILLTIAIGAHAYYFVADGVAYDTTSDSTCIVVKRNNGEPYQLKHVNIPSVVSNQGRNFTVTAIGDEAFGWSAIESITLPATITTIGDRAFNYCQSLKQISLPDAITAIGEHAFEGCGLRAIAIPPLIEVIQPFTFADCTELRRIHLPSGLECINFAAFRGCKLLKEIKIPENVNMIGDKVFDKCESLIKVIVDSNNITYDSRDRCNAIIEKLTNTLRFGFRTTQIPNSIETIGHGAFYNVWKLKHIIIPSNVTKIESKAFSMCKGLKSIFIPQSVTDLETGVFSACTSLESIYLPNTIKEIPSETFNNCVRLEHITMSDSLVSIGDGAFSGCERLYEITLPRSLEFIGNSAFANCTSLTRINIPRQVKLIGDETFYGCENLTVVTLPESITTIGESMFSGCASLQQISIPRTVRVIGFQAFYHSGIKSIELPPNVAKIDNDAFRRCENLVSIIIPNTVTSIGDGAFDGCQKLCTVNIPDTLTAINQYLFQDCQLLGEVRIPAKVTSIGKGAFSGCTSLRQANLPDSLTVIDDKAFANCQALTDLSFPHNLTYIGKEAFIGCVSIGKISLPRSITSVGIKAFDCCPSLQTDVNIDSLITASNSQNKMVSIPSKSFYHMEKVWLEPGVPGYTTDTLNILQSRQLTGKVSYNPSEETLTLKVNENELQHVFKREWNTYYRLWKDVTFGIVLNNGERLNNYRVKVGYHNSHDIRWDHKDKKYYYCIDFLCNDTLKTSLFEVTLDSLFISCNHDEISFALNPQFATSVNNVFLSDGFDRITIIQKQSDNEESLEDTITVANEYTKIRHMREDALKLFLEEERKINRHAIRAKSIGIYEARPVEEDDGDSFQLEKWFKYGQYDKLSKMQRGELRFSYGIGDLAAVNHFNYISMQFQNCDIDNGGYDMRRERTYWETQWGYSHLDHFLHFLNMVDAHTDDIIEAWHFFNLASDELMSSPEYSSYQVLLDLAKLKLYNIAGDTRAAREMIQSKAFDNYREDLDFRLQQLEYYLNCEWWQQSITLIDSIIPATRIIKCLYHPNNNEVYRSIAHLLRLKADCLAQLNDFDGAIAAQEESLAILDKSAYTFAVDYCEGFRALAKYQYSVGNCAKALSCSEYATSLSRDISYGQSTLYDTNIPKYLIANGRTEEAAGYVLFLSMGVQDNVGTLMLQSSGIRQHYWNKHRNWFQQDIPLFAHLLKNPGVSQIAYDAILFSKGLLLNTEISVKQLVEETGGVLQEAYNKWQEIKNKKPQDEEDIEANILELELAEREFIKQLREHTGLLRRLSVTWRDVRNALRSDEIAIEFVNYNIEADSVAYSAITLTNNVQDTVPRFHHLFTIPLSTRLSDMNDDVLSKMLWGALEPIIGNANTIYFSPMGELYNIAVESLPTWDNKCSIVSSRWKIYRLSSTREIALRDYRYQSDSINAVAYGGLRYDMQSEQLRHDSERYSFRSVVVEPNFGDREAEELLVPLPGTYDEVIKINDIYNKTYPNQIVTLTDTLGTESSFKALAGRCIHLIHIATHGFYGRDYTTRKKSRWTDNTYQLGHLSAEDNVMLQSGLFMAGAQLKVSNMNTSTEYEDGILTAYEIAHIDLRGLDLIVLSACQTGQGIVSGEGVFGLQRGFKKAGAKSILMSLWKVDDEATCMLMTEFYKYWIGENKSKHDSLELAKQAVRSHKEKGWDAPKYWAAFILLDGLD